MTGVWQGTFLGSLAAGTHGIALVISGLMTMLAAYVVLRKQAEGPASSRQSAEKETVSLALAFDKASDSVVVTDSQGIVQYVNPAFTRLTGYAPQQAIGQNARILQSGRQRTHFYKRLWETILAGEIWHGELINRRKDGTFYLEEMTITPALARDGSISRFIATKNAIPAIGEAHQAQALLASIVDHSEDAVLSVMPDGRIGSWNRGAELFYGYKAEEILGRSISDLVYSGHHDDLRQRQELIFRGESMEPFDGIAVTKSGKRVDISVRVFPIKDASGHVVRSGAVIRDISTRKQAEEAQAVLAAIVNSSHNAIFSTQLDGTLLTWNHAAKNNGALPRGRRLAAPWRC